MNVQSVAYFTDSQIKLQHMLADNFIPKKDQDFAISLATKRLVSEKQNYWVEKLIRDNQPRPAQAKQMVAGAARIIDMFNRAAGRLKTPKIVIEVAGRKIRLKRTSSKNAAPGTVYIDGGYGADVYYGKITPDGEVRIAKDGLDIQKELAEALINFAANPEDFAGTYGRLTGNCCFCSLQLTDERSVRVGYGPVCSGNYGLNWG